MRLSSLSQQCNQKWLYPFKANNLETGLVACTNIQKVFWLLLILLMPKMGSGEPFVQRYLQVISEQCGALVWGTMRLWPEHLGKEHRKHEDGQAREQVETSHVLLLLC